VTEVVTVRRARPEDAGEILVVQRAAYVLDAQLYSDPMIEPLVETFEDIEAGIRDAVVLVATATRELEPPGPPRSTSGPPRSAAGPRAPLRDDRATFGPLVADRVVGFVRGRLTGRSCRLDRLAVAPDHQGLGIGSALLTAVEDEVRDAADEITVAERDRIQARVRLYLRHGFNENYRDAAGPDIINVYLDKAVTRPGRPAADSAKA
jgi:ribosomal protein S18 acetylase RimI-like enzyme